MEKAFEELVKNSVERLSRVEDFDAVVRSWETWFDAMDEEEKSTFENLPDNQSKCWQLFNWSDPILADGGWFDWYTKIIGEKNGNSKISVQ